MGNWEDYGGGRQLVYGKDASDNVIALVVDADGNIISEVTQDTHGDLHADAHLVVGGSAVDDANPVPTKTVLQTDEGWSMYRTIDLDESQEEIKSAAGGVGGFVVLNMAASVRYLKLYDAVTGDVTVGTTTPDMTIPIPTLGDTNGAGLALDFGPTGLKFTTGICVAATTDLESNGAPGANEIILNAWYK